MAILDLDRAADTVGAVSLGLGAALAVAPGPTAEVLGLGHRPVLARTLGVADLAVGAGLTWGRPRWRWMAAHAALNVAVVACYVAEERRGGGVRAVAGRVTMLNLAVVDGAVAALLARRGT